LDWNFSGAEEDFKRAIAFNPNYASADHLYAIDLFALDRPQDSLAEARRTLEADPLSVPVNNILGKMLIAAHRYDQAIVQYRVGLRQHPSSSTRMWFASGSRPRPPSSAGNDET
jgi:tetratricopeptide (TPR) repeat protein